MSLQKSINEVESQINDLVEKCREIETLKQGYWRTDLQELRKDLRDVRRKEVTLRTENIVSMSTNQRPVANILLFVIVLLTMLLMICIRQNLILVESLNQQ